MNAIGRVALLAAVGGVGLMAANAQAPQAAACRPKSGDARPWLDRGLSPECRARLVIASFKSIDDKLAVLTEPRRGGSWLSDRGLPNVRGTDGPAGVRGGIGVTAFPTPLSVAASFDPINAARYGQLMGAEFHAAGYNQMGGPALDLTRTWHFGRSTESMGEDPYLISRIAAAEVKAVQANHVMTMVKHFAAYTQEQGRVGDSPTRAKPAVNMILSERVLREIYLPDFEAAIREGGAGQVMCSFPRINGTYACENPLTLGILKKEWGFDGQVVPDFPDAQRSIVAAVNAGLDSGIFVGTKPGETGAGGRPGLDNSFNGEDLREAVKSGKVLPARLDDLLMRRLVPEFRIGTFDNPAKRQGDDVSSPATRAALEEVIAAGTVLLKNKDRILPLGPSVRSIAVIGAQAGADPTVVELGSAFVAPSHVAPVLPAMRARAGSASVSYAPGTLGLGPLPLAPTSLFKTADGAAGWRAEYFANPKLDFSGKPLASRVEEAVNSTAVPGGLKLPGDKQYSVRWTALMTPVESGVQKFTLAGSGTAHLFIGGKLVARFDNADFGDTLYANVAMEAGKPVEVRVEYTPRTVLRDEAGEMFGTFIGPMAKLGWARPDDMIARAAEVAKAADVAVVFVGMRVGEGSDRASLALPNDQDALIDAVARANPRMIVVLQTGGAVTMPWLDRVAGVMQMWLPGDAIGPASAKLLFGDLAPSGRLPITFPRDESQGPAQRPSEYPGTLDATGALDEARHSEGLLIGYRWWDAKGQTPLFPFGYGLAYTNFAVTNATARAAPGGGAVAEARIRNTGDRAGAEVVQVYVSYPASDGEPPRQLKGFAKVQLAPGEERAVSIPLPRDSFRHWDERKRAWSVTPGSYTLSIGTSSRDFVGTIKVAIR